MADEEDSPQPEEQTEENPEEKNSPPKEPSQALMQEPEQATPASLVQVAGDSKEVKNSTTCQASCNKENLNKLPPKTYADKSTRGPLGPDVFGINPMQENLALVLYAVKDLRLEVRPIPEPKANQVLLQMEVVGICGSDVHYYVHGKIGHFVVESPMVIGHEASATVVKCGENVKSLKPGDRVAIEPHMPCRECEYCKSGYYNLCVNLFFCATPPDDGNLCRYYVHDADFCYKIPENMDFEHGTLMEPLAVGVHVCTRLKVTCGDYVLILGAGPIGLVTLLAAKAMGASKIIMTEIEDAKVKKALEMGANYAFNVSGMTDDDIVKNVYGKLGRAPNKTIDCCGSELAIRAGIKSTKSGGKFAAVGMGKDDILIPYSDFLIREVDILGSFRYLNNYPTAIDMVETGKIDPKPLITHHFKMEDAIRAFDMAANQEEPFIKILIHANPFWNPNANVGKHPSQMATPSKAPSSAVGGAPSAQAVRAPQSMGKVEDQLGANEEFYEDTTFEGGTPAEETTPEEAVAEEAAEEDTPADVAPEES